MSVEIANESGTAVDTDSILAVARYALDEMGVNPLAELSVLLVDTEYMAELNHRWMGGDGPTDVLAFPMDEGSITAGHSAADELHLLTVHGVLHLLGYDHAEPEEEREMFGLQARLLSGWQAQARRSS